MAMLLEGNEQYENQNIDSQDNSNIMATACEFAEKAYYLQLDWLLKI